MKTPTHNDKSQSRSAAVVTLGCPKNDVDSETMAGVLKSEGLEIVSTVENADIILINTCGFIESARIESLDAIMKVVEHKKEFPGKQIYVWGCMAERYLEQLRRDIPEIDGFFGVEPFSSLPSRITGRQPGSAENPFLSRLQSTMPHTAYLKIADGCDHLCTFCTIPLIKGRYRSRPPEMIMEEAEMLAGRGVRELILIAQDTTAYGHDLSEKASLGSLILDMSKIESVKWIRILYGHPAHVDDSLIRVIAEEEKVCKYLDIPLQHIADPILKAMRRGTRKKDIRDLIKRLRESIPGITLRTTFITGFPGETASDFDELREFVLESEFERLGVFTFSAEPGTAADGFKNRVSSRLAGKRQGTLMKIQQKISAGHNHRMIGKNIAVMIDGYDKTEDMSFGRTQGDSPEIDQLVWIPGSLPSGSISQVMIESAGAYDLIGAFPGV